MLNFRICHFGTLSFTEYAKNGILSLVIIMELIELRKKYSLSQQQAAKISNVPLRTYIRYETNDSYGNSLKRLSIINIINEKCEITETKGILTLDFIKEQITKIINEHYKKEIEFCYLFGSYAKGYAKENSDVDICVSTNLSGIRFMGISEKIREVLNKKIDLVKFSNITDNPSLISEILKDGIKIYG